MSEHLNDPRRRDRLRFRSWHRGTREMDLLLGSFADLHLHAFSSAQLDLYEALLEQPDPDIYNWIIGKEPVPADCDNEVTRLVRSHRYDAFPSTGKAVV